MPRLPPSLIKQAWRIDSLLPLLLRQCRSLASAQNELRWMREHLNSVYKEKYGYNNALAEMCRKRSRGRPLQYLLGSTPFGDLDILCRPGVLIPRPETEAYTGHLADLVFRDAALSNQNELNVLDLCTGTGAITLLLHSMLYQQFESLNGLGVDFSEKAIALARQNVEYNGDILRKHSQPYHNVAFAMADILEPDFISKLQSWGAPSWDIVISNPPYISKASYWKDTGRSVRLFEPASALVPPDTEGVMASQYLQAEDIFYPAILNISTAVGAQIVVMEVADLEQALRVAKHANSLGNFDKIEIWRDWPQDGTVEVMKCLLEAGKTYDIDIIGSGHGRSVVCRV